MTESQDVPASDIEQEAPAGEAGPSVRSRLAGLPWKRLTLGLGLLFALGSLAIAIQQAVTWPDVGSLSGHNPQSTAFMERYKARAKAAGHNPAIRWRWTPYDRISPHLKRAVLVAEDIGFFSHNGFEFTEIKVAIGQALRGERGLRGASTITQQLAKNLWLSPSRNPLRKLKETILTYQLERQLTKKRILEIYLNVVEFGPGVYGAEAASRHYFGKSAADLDEVEAAMLAASLPKPSRWNPDSDSRWYRKYAAQIGERMDRAEFLWKRI
jgi:monofunctional biosynthetic peptidoglycan transglycosylase